MRLFRLYASIFRAIGTALASENVRALLGFVFLIALLQAVVFALLEGWSILDGFYFAVVTMATVGYGDFAPETGLGKLAALFFMVIGIGVFVLAISTFAQAFLREIFVLQQQERDRAMHGDGDGTGDEPKP